MGAVCYRPKPTSISKEEILRALNDKHLKETITEPDGAKTFKTDEQSSYHLLTFGNLTQHVNMEETSNGVQSVDKLASKTPTQAQNRMGLTNQVSGSLSGNSVELNILTYFGHKEEIYKALTMMSRKSLYFMKKNYRKIENQTNIKHCNEKLKFIPVKSIEEHQSGVNQLLKINAKELVSASDDCYLKFWSASSMKVEASLATETITCIALTGAMNPKQKEILVAGCHSGNLLMISTSQKAKKEQINSAHYNLIRVIVTLEALKNKYFVTADVCGIVKVWTAQFKAQQVMEIDQDGAISYNSMIEVSDWLPKRSGYEDAAVIACALKSQKINLILLLPGQATYQVLKTLKSTMKPTCLIQLSNKHLAIAIGSLKEESHIEIHDINKNKIVSTLKMHKDMIDSMLKVEFPSDKLKFNNPYITWFLSASRDRQIVLWKLIDGKIMHRNQANLQASNKKISTVANNNGVRSFQELKKNTQQKINKHRNKPQKQSRRGQSNQNDIEDDFEDERNEEDSRFEDEEEGSDSNNSNEEEKQQESLPNSSSQKNLLSPLPQQQQDKIIDYYYSFDTGHKDFVRSMVQLNNGQTLITASEDKTIKIFTIGF